jgi:hypothetical protein
MADVKFICLLGDFFFFVPCSVFFFYERQTADDGDSILGCKLAGCVSRIRAEAFTLCISAESRDEDWEELGGLVAFPSWACIEGYGCVVGVLGCIVLPLSL